MAYAEKHVNSRVLGVSKNENFNIPKRGRNMPTKRETTAKLDAPIRMYFI
jgi:hypothetical protein